LPERLVNITKPFSEEVKAAIWDLA